MDKSSKKPEPTPEPTQLTYGDETPSQYVNLYRPGHDAPKCEGRKPPALFLVHGGYWKGRYNLRADNAAHASIRGALLACGVAVADVEYRRDDDEDEHGRACGFPHANRDVLRAYVALVKTLPRDAPVVMCGHSAGATLVLWLCAQFQRRPVPPALRGVMPPCHVVALAPVADLALAARLCVSDDGDAVQKYMHGTPHSLPREYADACPTMLVPLLARVPLAVFHGARDYDVPRKVVSSFVDTLREYRHIHCITDVPLVFKSLPDTDHYDIVQASSTAWKVILSDILSHLDITTP